MEPLKLVIVGMVDHGKSTLIGRLLYDTGSIPEAKMEDIKKTCKALGRDIEFAYVIDHLQEEREQEMTIDTAQTFFTSNKRKYVIIDAPGHVEFIKNMMTGASQADAAVLIIDANKGVEVQTRRHSVILHMLGLKNVIVVINKMDLVKYDQQRYEQVKQEILQFLKTIDITPLNVIPISAKNGDFIANYTETMEWYQGPCLLDSLDSLQSPQQDFEKPFIYPVQDVYEHDKKLFVGRIESGKIKQNDEVVILPDSRKTTINEIRVFLKEKKEAQAGECIAVALKDSAERGQIIAHEKTKPAITSSFKANLFWLAPEGYKTGEQLTLKCSTQETTCSLESITRYDSSTLQQLEANSDKINETELAETIINSSKPLCITSFGQIPELGRFVLVKNDAIVAGGIITHV